MPKPCRPLTSPLELNNHKSDQTTTFLTHPCQFTCGIPTLSAFSMLMSHMTTLAPFSTKFKHICSKRLKLILIQWWLVEQNEQVMYSSANSASSSSHKYYVTFQLFKGKLPLQPSCCHKQNNKPQKGREVAHVCFFFVCVLCMCFLQCAQTREIIFAGDPIPKSLAPIHDFMVFDHDKIN